MASVEGSWQVLVGKGLGKCAGPGSPPHLNFTVRERG